MGLFVGLVISALVVIAGAFGFIYSGLYDVSATDQHTAQVYWVLKTVMRRAVHHHARPIHVPELGDQALIARGRTLFSAQCARCHGAPGVARDAFALGLRPAPANLANTGIEWSDRDLFWTIKYGLKMTGMPAWQFRLQDDAIWSVVAYVRRMPYESPRTYRGEVQASAQSVSGQNDAPTTPDHAAHESEPPTHAGDAGRGRHALQQYGCIVCHEIPGIVGATAPVGPPLEHMALRSFVGGVIVNTPENMVRWLRTPQQFVPDGAMPNLGVSEQDARDMAAYLQKLR
jgi:mono/diheme cytochrome c family protein